MTFFGTLLEFPRTSSYQTPKPGSVYFGTFAGIANIISVLGTRRPIKLLPIITATTPLTGATITANTVKDDQTHIVTPAGTIATLAFVLPSAANSQVGQIIRLQSTQIVTALTVTVAGSGTVGGAALTAVAVSVPYAWQCTSVAGAGVWHRIQ